MVVQPNEAWMIAGVDGCPGGWIVAMAEAWPPERLAWMICRSFGDVLDRTAGCEAVMVDMPIGLPEENWPRECDRLAKKHLGWASARIFPAPPRSILDRTDPVSFQRAHLAITGRKAVLPLWGIVPKLREIDAWMTPTLQERVMEFHPELTWQKLAQEPLPSKHRWEGIERRLRLLEREGIHHDAWEWREKASKRAHLHDLLDALIGLEAAWRKTLGVRPCHRLPPSDPPRDAKGLRMEIWF